MPPGCLIPSQSLVPVMTLGLGTVMAAGHALHWTQSSCRRMTSFPHLTWVVLYRSLSTSLSVRPWLLEAGFLLYSCHLFFLPAFPSCPDEAILSWKGGRISFSTYLSECSRIPGAFGGISSNVNNRRSWWLSLWTAVLDCKASLGTIEFLEGRKVDCGEQRDKVENGIFNNSRPFLLMEHSGYQVC